MIFVILSLHLLVCLCLIGLVLLQRSEGGALGMGGGSGALVSGRGAADALARMTSVAGGFFLVTSLGLTFLSGAAGANAPRGSVLDARPGAAVAPLTLPEAPADAGAANDAILDVAAVDATADAAATPTPPPEAAPRAAPLPTAAPSTAPPRPTRSADATPNRGAAPTAPRTNPRPLVLPDSSGAALTLDPSQLEESVQTGDRLEAVRRERAGPDQ